MVPKTHTVFLYTLYIKKEGKKGGSTFILDLPKTRGKTRPHRKKESKKFNLIQPIKTPNFKLQMNQKSSIERSPAYAHGFGRCCHYRTYRRPRKAEYRKTVSFCARRISDRAGPARVGFCRKPGSSMEPVQGLCWNVQRKPSSLTTARRRFFCWGLPGTRSLIVSPKNIRILTLQHTRLMHKKAAKQFAKSIFLRRSEDKIQYIFRKSLKFKSLGEGDV